MLRFQTFRRFQREEPQPTPTDVVKPPEIVQTPADKETSNVRRKERNEEPSICERDYINVFSKPYLSKILHKQGDKSIFFADRVLRVTRSGRMKRRILLITESSIYLVDPDTFKCKRRIALSAIEKFCLTKLMDNFFAIIVPTEYDLLMASTRKTEILTSVLDACKCASAYEPDLLSSNRFEYQAAAHLSKEVQFEEIEGGVKTTFVSK